MHVAQFPSRGIIGRLEDKVFCDVGAVLLRNGIKTEPIQNLAHDLLARAENYASVQVLSTELRLPTYRRPADPLPPKLVHWNCDFSFNKALETLV
jgi:hypothetical protein